MREPIVIPYHEQLEKLAERLGTTLPKACRQAGVASSIYYRSKNGVSSMTYPVARRIEEGIMATAATPPTGHAAPL